MKSYFTSFAILVLFLAPISPSFATTPEYIPVDVDKKTTEEPDKTLVEKTEETTEEKIDEKIDAPPGIPAKESLTTRERREMADFFVLANYSPLDLYIPNKMGGTLGWISGPEKTWELEYLRSSVSMPFFIKDLGSITDQRISIMGRAYRGNSFNFSYGLSYFDLSMHLGDDIMNRVSGGSYPSLDIIDLKALGFNLGIGNRWTFAHGITLGVDWVTWSQPAILLSKKSTFLDYADNPNDRKNVEDAIRFASYFPRFSFLKLQLGMVF